MVNMFIHRVALQVVFWLKWGFGTSRYKWLFWLPVWKFLLPAMLKIRQSTEYISAPQHRLLLSAMNLTKVTTGRNALTRKSLYLQMWLLDVSVISWNNQELFWFNSSWYFKFSKKYSFLILTWRPSDFHKLLVTSWSIGLYQ